jgi:cold shock CspA family protein/ribosome-associated translation inhibitor RaiA
MKIPLQISFRDLEPSAAIEAAIRARAGRLERFSGDIMGCRVAVEAPHRQHRTGRHYRVRIDLTVPGGEIVVGRDPPARGAHEDVYVAIRDSFQAAQRRLEDFERRRRGQVKSSERPLRGRVVRLVPEESCGFLQAQDGHEVYFHRNSVLDGYERLHVGTSVRYAEEPGDKGPHASSVAISGGHRGH